VKVTIWGSRGSIPAPGPETMRYGGNTSCVQVTLSDGTLLVLDAGTGIRALGLTLARAPQQGPVNILLTHLHLDHIQGLMFFAPCFHSDAEVVVWGPSAPASPASPAARASPLLDRIARYISAPLSPVDVRELPARVAFREAPPGEWRIGPATVRACAVSHRGPTLGYRIEDAGATLCYIPDHEPALGTPLDELEDEWISGLELAAGADLLIHDAQYTDEEYPRHLGWGHSSISDALAFARRAEARRLVLFHHDPRHGDDFLDAVAGDACARWEAAGGRAGALQMAAERLQLSVEAPRPSRRAPSARPAAR
jgi:phosphoribosyl 1,2-cyclic phosphodiesterase